LTENLPAVAEAQTAIAEAKAANDPAAANAAYAQELDALRGDNSGKTLAITPAETGPAAASTEVVENMLTALAEYEPDEVAELRRVWPGKEMGDNIAYVHWLADRYSLAGQMDGVVDSVGLLRLGAVVARQVHAEVNRAKPPTTTTRTENKPMNSPDVAGLDDEAFEERLEASRDKQRDLLSRGLTKRANAENARELGLIELRHGNAPVVGRHGRNA